MVAHWWHITCKSSATRSVSLFLPDRAQTNERGVVSNPFTGMLSLQVAQDSNGNKLSYIVLPGNESVLMADAMAKRSWWKAVEKGSPNNYWWGGNGQRFGWQDFQRGRHLRPVTCASAEPEHSEHAA